MSNSDVLYEARLHKIIFTMPIIIMLIGIYAMLKNSYFFYPGLFTTAFGACWILMTWLAYQFSSIQIKKNQAVLASGLFVRKIVDMPFNKIETVDIRQNILGGLLGYGTLIITGTGGTVHYVNYIEHPLTCRRFIEQCMHDK
jgi:uncharacterized membrane protein YdbT with pleckstrin-like domain